MKKVTNRMNDFEAQVSSQLQMISTDIEKRIAFMGTQTRAVGGEATAPGMDHVANDLDAIKYDVSELKDLMNGAKSDTAHVKRIVLACERDMEDFTAAMDAVNVDLDEMRARVDSTHSIITSRCAGAWCAVKKWAPASLQSSAPFLQRGSCRRLGHARGQMPRSHACGGPGGKTGGDGADLRWLRHLGFEAGPMAGAVKMAVK